MHINTVTGTCHDWQGQAHQFRFSWADDAGLEWGNLYLDGQLRAEMHGFEKLRTMVSAVPDHGQAFPDCLGPPRGW